MNFIDNNNTNNIIVYCFLTYNNLDRTDIWEKYFEKKKNFKVYIHSKEPIQPFHYSFPINIIKNPINTISKSHISIVQATIHLLKEAYDNTPEATHFIFLTQSCIPLYSFDKHFQIISKMKKSCISVIMGNKVERYNSLSMNLKKNIEYSKFAKQQPNMVLTRDDIKLIIENNFLNDFKFMECPDEHYFVNLFLHIYKKDFHNQLINYCNPEIYKTQALTFFFVDKHCIIRARNIGCLFMRKVNRFSRIDLSFILNN
jgi:hypothetical protein